MKPFKVGEKVKTRDGRDARIICVDRAAMDDVSPIVALVQCPPPHKGEMIYSYQRDGRYCVKNATNLDLVRPMRKISVNVAIAQHVSHARPYCVMAWSLDKHTKSPENTDLARGKILAEQIVEFLIEE